MSCKEKPVSKHKHYTQIEKNVFLQILEKYKNIIELKKSDGTTLKDKDIAWNEICEEYNQSTLIVQERTVQQLKKLWANLKQSQRDALTKEKQACLATGGGPQETEANIDPNVLNIAPHLMENAPVLFTSNMTETEIKDKREIAFNVISTNANIEVLDSIEEALYINDESDKENSDVQDKPKFTFLSNDNTEIDNGNKDQRINTFPLKQHDKQFRNSTTFRSITSDVQKRKRKYQNQELSDTEDNLRMQRIRQVMDQDQQLALVKLRHEENCAKIKENHLKQINEMEIQHKNKINNLEIHITEIKVKILENHLEKEKIDITL